MKVIGYVRVSTEGQIDGFGIEAQEKAIKDYCEREGHEIIRWVSDLGESGAKFRAGLDEIVFGSVENPPYEAVVVAKSDRIARDINIYFYYKGALKRKDIQLISVAEDFGAMGAYAHLLEAFVQVCAEMERENITRRMTAGREIKAAKGGYSGGRPPFGYKAVRGEGLEIIPEEADVVYRIFKLRQVHSIRKVTELINLSCVNRKGLPFSVASIQTILENENFYKGLYRYGKDEWVQGQHQPIIK